MNCEFLEPKNYLGVDPAEGEFWNYSKMDCIDQRFETIQIANTEEIIFFDKSISSMEILFVVLFIFLILGFIFSFIFKLVYPFSFRYINKKER